MAYANLPTELLDQLETSGVSRDARLLLIEMYAHSAHVLNDGYVQIRLSRICDHSDPELLLDELMRAGYIEAVTGGVVIVDYLRHNATRVTIELARQKNRERQDRHRKHKAGDHSECIRSRFCPIGEVIPDVCMIPEGAARDHART